VIVIHAVLHRSLKQALRWGLISSNPTDAVNRPRFRRKEMRTLDDTQMRSLLMVVKRTRFEALFWIALTTGLRQGELLGLRWSDLDWATRRLTVQRQLQRLDGGFAFTEPKSASGKRLVILGQQAINKLRDHINILQQERVAAADRWEENDLIFPSSIGTPWDHSNVVKHYKSFLQQAGLPNIRFHDLRHTAATMMLQQGVNPKIVQERLGHADITLTLNTYSHVLPAMQEEAAEKMDELLTPIEVSEEIKRVGEKQSLPRPRPGGSQEDR
jgi:integrase